MAEPMTVLARVEPPAAPEQQPVQPASTVLGRLGLRSREEALLCLPSAFTDLRVVSRRMSTATDRVRKLYAFHATGQVFGYDKAKRLVKDPLERRNWGSIKRMEVILEDEVGQRVSWSLFGGFSALKEMPAGEVVVMAGKISWFGREGEESAYLTDAEPAPGWAIGRIWVRYSGIPGRVAGEVVQDLVRTQVDNPDAYRACARRICDALGMTDDQVAAAMGGRFKSCEELLYGLHAPKTIEEGEEARSLAITIAARSVQAAALHHNLRHPHYLAPIPMRAGEVGLLAQTQVEPLTADQEFVAHAIAERLTSTTPLNSLLSGDVGTGKTLAYLLPAVAAHRAGARVTIMAPTAILADQIARQIAGRFAGAIRGVVLLDAKTRARKKPPDLDHILVGTSGVASFAAKHGYAPHVLICDEQHKLSATTRESLVQPWTHCIEVTATPIPRSMATALFGGKEVFTLKECPVEKKFENYLGDVEHRREFLTALRQAVDAGGRAAVVFPRVQDQASDGDGAAKGPDQAKSSVLQGARLLEEKFPGKVAVLHGDLPEAEVIETVEAVKAGKYSVIVASTLLETGIDIPSLTAMIVRDADHFGMAQLHQLRGRCARNGGVAKFMMMVESLDALDDLTMSRLRAVQQCTDGFELAERDLLLRGFGDLSGSAQSGAEQNSVFRLVSLRPDDYVRKRVVEEGQSGIAAESIDALSEAEIAPYAAEYEQEARDSVRRQQGLFS